MLEAICHSYYCEYEYMYKKRINTHHVFSPSYAYTDSVTEVLCEGEEKLLQCATTDLFISIDNVFFGRDDVNVCPHERGNVTDCAGAADATRWAGGVCGGRKTCSFAAEARARGDPCPDVHKMARLQYHCQGMWSYAFIDKSVCLSAVYIHLFGDHILYQIFCGFQNAQTCTRTTFVN